MRRELKKFRIIKIKNFGSIELKELKSRKAFNVVTKQFEFKERPKRLKFTTESKLSSFLTKIVEFIV
jgi:nucleoid DNA-binding protein